MKKTIISVFVLMFISISASAKDEVFYVDIKDALNSKFAKEMLNDNDISFIFGKYDGKDVFKKNIKLHKSTIKYRSKRNFNTKEIVDIDKKVPCNYAFVAALKALAKDAKKEGATKIVNIRNNHKHKIYQDKEKFQCARGSAATSVYFLVDYAK